MLYHNSLCSVPQRCSFRPTQAYTHKVGSFEFKMTIAFLIETCIRIRFDRIVRFVSRIRNKQHHQNSCCLLSSRSFFLWEPKTQQKRTILSYHISLRILNELWNIIHNNTYSTGAFLLSFSRLFFPSVSFFAALLFSCFLYFCLFERL